MGVHLLQHYIATNCRAVYICWLFRADGASIREPEIHEKKEETMNRRRIFLYAVATVFAALLISSGIPEAYADDLRVNAICSTTTLTGSYGFYRTGDTPGSLTAVGKITLDESGNFTARQHVSRNGEFQFSKFSGRNQIAADCTFKVLDENGGLIGTGIIVDDGDGFFILNRTPGNNVCTVGRKIHSQ
jgi:hypothetical protein